MNREQLIRIVVFVITTLIVVILVVVYIQCSLDKILYDIGST